MSAEDAGQAERSSGAGWRYLVGMQIAVLAIIAVIDYLMGDAAQVLNGYEILRRTFAQPFNIGLPVASESYILLQEETAPFSLLWAWLLYVLWACVFAGPLFLLIKWLRSRSPEERNA